MQTHTFIKDGIRWYIDLPQFIEQGGSQGDLEMVDGADTMLNLIAGEANTVSLTMSTASFEGADMLELTEKCDPYIGGGYYILRTWEGRSVMKSMWLCAVTEFVFGDLPETIFVKSAEK